MVFRSSRAFAVAFVVEVALGCQGSTGPAGTSTGSVSGTISGGGAALPGATVSFSPGGLSVVSGANGAFTAALPIGVYAARVAAPGFAERTVPGVSVVAGQTTPLDVALEAVVSPVVADAGVDRWQAGFGVEVALDGSASVGPSPLGFTWRQTGGPPADLSGAGTAVARFTTVSFEQASADHLVAAFPDDFAVLGFTFEDASTVTYEFELEVSAGGTAARDRVRIQVVPPQPPVRSVPVGQLALLGSPSAGPWAWSCARLDGAGAEVPCAAGELAGDASQTPAFRPAVEAVYVLRETTQPDPLVLTASTYVGTRPDQPGERCGSCHGERTSYWSETAHATFFRRSIDGLTSPEYGPTCIRCHTVGFNPEAANRGFDDLAAETGWTFPATLAEGNSEALPEALKPLAEVACESCHGPGSLHAATSDPARIGRSFAAVACAQCHSKEPYEIQGLQWENSVHGYRALDFSEIPWVDDPSIRGTCGSCHSAPGYVAWWKAGVEAPPPPVGDGTSRLSCVTCHEPHALARTPDGFATPRLLRVHDLSTTLVPGVAARGVGAGALCMSCHNGRVTFSLDVQAAPHPSSQAEILLAKGAQPLGGAAFPSSAHAGVPDLCVGCHMAPTPPAGAPQHNELGGHTFAVRVNEFEHVAACTGCHPGLQRLDRTAYGDYDGDGILEGIREEVDGLDALLTQVLSARAAELWPVETAGPAPTVVPFRGRIRILKHFDWATDPSGECQPYLGFPWPERCFAFAEGQIPTGAQAERDLLAAAWNEFLLAGDRSRGLHNAAFAVSVLQRSYEAIAGAPVPGATPR